MYHKSGVRGCGDDAAALAAVGDPHPLQSVERPVRRPEPHHVHARVDPSLEMHHSYSDYRVLT